MTKIQSFKDLTVWQRSRQLVVGVYKATKLFPSEEQFGLSSQIRRASVSIASNIAEGFSRQTVKDKINFYHMSLGSCTEVQNQVILAADLGFISNEISGKLEAQTIEIHKMLNGLIKSLKEN